MTEKKEKLSVGVFGNVDAGKSTLIGHLLYKCGLVDRRVFGQLEQSALEMGKGPFTYAFILQQLTSKSSRNDLLTCQFETETKCLTMMDLIGYRNYAQSIISSCSQADGALLLVPASLGEFEASLSKFSAPRQQMLVAQTSGIKEVIVAVNKMDLTEPSYSEERFSEIRTEMTLCLKKMGYQQTDLIFVPISAWRGENLVDPSKQMPWFKGHPFRQQTCFTLLEALDSLTSRDRTGMST